VADGQITVEGPDEPTILKMLEIAKPRMTAAALVAAAASSAVGCGGSSAQAPSPLVRDGEVELVRAPDGAEYDLPVWLPGARRLVVVLSPSGHTDDAAYDTLLAMRADGSGRQRLRLPRRQGCRFTSADVPTRLPDGRLGYSEKCWGTDVPRRAVRLRSYDPATHSVGVVRPYELPFSWSFFASATRERGVINDGRSLEERLWRLGVAGPEELPLDFDRVGYPRWSPSGHYLSLDAVPKGTAGSGPGRLDAPRNLYLLDATLRVDRVLVRGATRVGPAGWSPDGRWLALVMQPEHRPLGLYLVSARSGRARLVIERDHLGGVDWLSPRTLLVAVGVFSHIEHADGDVGLYRIRLPRLE
jgi:hypothetical protein